MPAAYTISFTIIFRVVFCPVFERILMNVSPHLGFHEADKQGRFCFNITRCPSGTTLIPERGGWGSPVRSRTNIIILHLNEEKRECKTFEKPQCLGLSEKTVHRGRPIVRIL